MGSRCSRPSNDVAEPVAAEDRPHWWLPNAKHNSDLQITAEAIKFTMLSPAERPDLITSVKLGVDPTAPVITQAYRFEELLGRGAFGEVVLGTHIESQRQYAIKKLATSTLKQGSLKAEVRILKECRHPNIISLREVCDRWTRRAPSQGSRACTRRARSCCSAMWWDSESSLK